MDNKATDIMEQLRDILEHFYGTALSDFAGKAYMTATHRHRLHVSARVKLDELPASRASRMQHVFKLRNRLAFYDLKGTVTAGCHQHGYGETADKYLTLSIFIFYQP